MKKTNKKGVIVIPMILLGMVMLFVLAIFYIKLDGVSNRVYDIGLEQVDGDVQAMEMITDQQSSGHLYNDNFFLFMFGGIWLSCLIAGYYSDYGSFILIIMIFLMAGTGLVASYLSDYWKATTADGVDVGSRADYPYTYFILDNFLYLILLVFGSAIIVSIVRDY